MIRLTIQKIEINSTKGKLVLYLFGAGLLVLCGTIVLLTSIGYMHSEPSGSTAISRSKEFAFIISIVGILFFGILMVYIIHKIFNGKPILIVNQDGFTDDSTISALGFTSWREVKDIGFVQIGNIKMIGIELFEINRKLINKSWYKKKLVRGNISMNYPPITINLQAAKDKPDEVLAIMNKYWNEWKQNNQH